MRLLDRVNRTLAESRAITSVPWKPWESTSWTYDIGGPAHPSRSGANGVDGALSLAPVYAATRLLADNVAALPLQQYRDLGQGKKMKMPLGQLLSMPSAYGNLFEWLYAAMTSLVLQGNAYGLITGRDGYGYPTSIEWLAPESMFVQDTVPYNPARAEFFYYGNLIKNPRESLIHIRSMVVAGRTEGISPMKAFQMYIENGLEALGYGTGWYRAGGFPPGTFKNKDYEVSDEQSSKIKAKLVSAMRRREPLVYGRDWDYHEIAVPPNEAQFIQAMQLNATQIASIYGVPPHRIGGSAAGGSVNYSNTESEQIGLITDTLDPWLVRFENALLQCLPERQYVRFNRNARIRTDTATRYGVYETARNIGLNNIDELRDLEDMSALPGGKGKDYTPLQVLVATAGNRNAALSPGDKQAAQEAQQMQRRPQRQPQQPSPDQQQRAEDDDTMSLEALQRWLAEQ